MEKEVQLRDYDGLIGHTTIVMMSFLFLAVEQRLQDDPRIHGTLFHACDDDLKDISILGALQRMMVALNKVRAVGELAGDVILKILEAVVPVVLAMLKAPGVTRVKNIL